MDPLTIAAEMSVFALLLLLTGCGKFNLFIFFINLLICSYPSFFISTTSSIKLNTGKPDVLQEPHAPYCGVD